MSNKSSNVFVMLGWLYNCSIDTTCTHTFWAKTNMCVLLCINQEIARPRYIQSYSPTVIDKLYQQRLAALIDWCLYLH